MDTTLQDYKENSVYAVQGEYPITSEMIEQGGFSMASSDDGSYEKSKYDGNNTIRLRSKDLISVKPNTTYGILNTLSTLCYNVYQWDGNRQFLEGLSKYFQPGSLEVFTTSPNTHYIHFLMSKPNANNTISLSEYDWSQFHMYELDSTINLRSLPNGVKDELNLLTGEYIQRVGEVVLDGSEVWMPSESFTSTFNSYYSVISNSIYINNLSFISDNFITLNGASSLGTQQGFYMGNYIGELAPFISTTLSTVDELKTYLQQNPLTVQYELAEPIISHVRLVSNNQEREVGIKLPNGVSNTYNPSTGITTVRVGKIVLDGSEDWDVYDQAPSNLDYFRLPMPTMFTTGNMNADKETECKYIVSDAFPTVGYYQIQKANSTINYSVISGMHSSSLGVQCLFVYYKPSADLATFKAYLASNPITVWYELKYPQIQPDIVLPNGVHDEYNPETGVYTKRVGLIEFDGSEDENWGVSGRNGEITSGNYCYYYNKYSNTISQLPKVNTLPLCDKLQSGLDNIVADNPMYVAIGNTEQEFRINIPSGESSATACKQWLVANPLKVWYELATPITYQLTPYFGLPQPYAYEDGYLIHDSAYAKTTLPPEFKYKLVANRTGQVMQNNRKLQEHTTRLSNLEALIIEATIQSLFDRELQTFELELMDIQLIDLGE